MNVNKHMVKGAALVVLAIIPSLTIQAKSCLWEVKSDTGTLYIQGSVHVLKAEHYPLDPAIEEAYTKSSTIVFETDPLEMMQPETQQLIMKSAMFPGGTTLGEVLEPKLYNELRAELKTTGRSIAGFQQFEPWFVALTLTMAKMQARGFAPQHGLETYLSNKAQSDSKPVIGLESIEFQIDLMNTLSELDPNAYIRRTLDDLDMIEQQTEELSSAWINGNIEAIGTLIDESFKEYPRFRDMFILDRNRRWLQEIETFFIKDKTHMVVVGAGHLPGKGGLLELLQEKGYSITQL